jgi:hypothetical protein
MPAIERSGPAQWMHGGETLPSMVAVVPFELAHSEGVARLCAAEGWPSVPPPGSVVRMKLSCTAAPRCLGGGRRAARPSARLEVLQQVAGTVKLNESSSSSSGVGIPTKKLPPVQGGCQVNFSLPTPFLLRDM